MITSVELSVRSKKGVYPPARLTNAPPSPSSLCTSKEERVQPPAIELSSKLLRSIVILS